jgi:hypothetical protein
MAVNPRAAKRSSPEVSMRNYIRLLGSIDRHDLVAAPRSSYERGTTDDLGLLQRPRHAPAGEQSIATIL